MRLHSLYRDNPSARGGLDILAREGPGDYRHGSSEDARGHGRARDGAQYHNPYPVIKGMDHRAQREVIRYVAKRNGLPEDATWTTDGNWRRPGWQDRAARHGLDLAAIAQADHELSRSVTKSL